MVAFDSLAKIVSLLSIPTNLFLTKNSLMLKINIILIIILISTLFSCSNLKQNSTSDEAHQKWQDWRKDYDLTVIGKGSWLSLAGLYWLTEGTNTLGSAKNNSIQFPDDTPSYIASINVSNNQLKINVLNNQVLVNSKKIESSELSVKEKTIVSFGNYDFYIIQREIGFAIRLINNHSENIKSFSGTRFYPFSQDWILPARLIQSADSEILKIPTVYGTTREDKSAGWVEFEVNGELQRLQAVDYGKENLMYVMFSDVTSGDTTYGAGRYIEVEWPDENGNTFIDFNRAYNPACAFTDYATCPLTPKQNRLKVAIKAGELDVEH